MRIQLGRRNHRLPPGAAFLDPLVLRPQAVRDRELEHHIAVRSLVLADRPVSQHEDAGQLADRWRQNVIAASEPVGEDCLRVPRSVVDERLGVPVDQREEPLGRELVAANDVRVDVQAHRRPRVSRSLSEHPNPRTSAQPSLSG